MLSDSTILKHIARQPKCTAGFKQLVRELGLHGDERRELNARLLKLVVGGALIAVDSDRYALPQAAADKNLVVGRLTMHRDGFGFVIPDASSLPAALKSRLAGDIFIAPHLIGNAMHGDRVLVDISNVRPDGRAEGRIVRPVVRANPTVVGIFHYGSRHNYVAPMDSKITQEIMIPAGMEYPEQKGEETEILAPLGMTKNSGKGENVPSRSQWIACWETRSRGGPSGMISKVWWWMWRSPTGLRRRRIRGDAYRDSRTGRRLRRRRRNHDPEIPSASSFSGSGAAGGARTYAVIPEREF